MQRAGLRDVLALVGSRRLREDDRLGDVNRQLPAVLGMRLLDIDDEELDSVPIALGDLLQAPGLLAEGRSGIGAEDEGDGAAVLEIGEAHLLIAVAQHGQLEVGRRVAHVGRARLADGVLGPHLLHALAGEPQALELLVRRLRPSGLLGGHDGRILADDRGLDNGQRG